MRIAQILNDKVHWIFEAEEMPNWPPDAEGNPIILVNITNRPEIQEGWIFNSETEEFTPPVEQELEPISPTILPVTNEEVVQAVMYLTASQDITSLEAQPVKTMAFGVNSPRYDFWRFAYFRNHTNLFTLNKLVEGGVLTQYEVDRMIADRMEIHGF